MIGRTLTEIQIPEAFARMKAIHALYQNHKVYSLVIIADGLANNSNEHYAVGISAGHPATVKTENDIAKLNPARQVNASKSFRLVVPQHVLNNISWTSNTVCTIYAIGSADNLATLRVAYDIEFDSPHP